MINGYCIELVDMLQEEFTKYTVYSALCHG